MYNASYHLLQLEIASVSYTAQSCFTLMHDQ